MKLMDPMDPMEPVDFPPRVLEPLMMSGAEERRGLVEGESPNPEDELLILRPVARVSGVRRFPVPKPRVEKPSTAKEQN